MFLPQQNIFLQFDFDKSGSMSSYELRGALKAAGKRGTAFYLINLLGRSAWVKRTINHTSQVLLNRKEVLTPERTYAH